MPKQLDSEAILEWVRQRLFWLSGVQRKELMQRFNVGSAYASRLLNDLASRCPAVVRDGQRLVLADERFIPRGAAERMLAGLYAAEVGAEPPSGLAREIGVPILVADRLRRAVRPEVLRAVLCAISEAREIELSYVGMELGRTATRRWVEPARIVHINGRWHVRAWCDVSNDWRDFVLSRILAVHESRDARRRVASAQTKKFLPEGKTPVKYVPHPSLTDDQKTAVALEFDMDMDFELMLDDPTEIFYFEASFVAQNDFEGPPKKLLVRKH